MLKIPFQHFQIEYLEVYQPNEAEKEDATLYARNVRAKMALSLEIPIVNKRLEDGKSLLASKEVLNNIIIEDDFVPKKTMYNYVDFTGNLGLVS